MAARLTMSQELRSIFADGSLALTVANLLTKAGHKAFCVGGAVRDALLGNPFDDVDVATDAFPAQVRHLAEDAGLKVKLAGFAFGSIKNHPWSRKCGCDDIAS